MSFLAGKSGVQVVGDLRYVAAQAATLMVAVADWVCGVRVTEARLRPLRNTSVGLKEELQDAETECRVLSEQNCVVAGKKAILKEHVLTLEDRAERLEDRVSFLNQEKKHAGEQIGPVLASTSSSTC